MSPYCEPGPSGDARLGLSRPLGSRVLLDLSRYPFQQRAWDPAVQSMDPRFPAFTGPGGGVLELTGASGADPAPYDIDFRPWEEVDLLSLEVRCAGEGRFEVRLEEDARTFDCAGLTSVSFVPTEEERQTFSVASTGSVRYALRMTGLTPAERYSIRSQRGHQTAGDGPDVARLGLPGHGRGVPRSSRPSLPTPPVATSGSRSRPRSPCGRSGNRRARGRDCPGVDHHGQAGRGDQPRRRRVGHGSRRRPGRCRRPRGADRRVGRERRRSGTWRLARATGPHRRAGRIDARAEYFARVIARP